MSVSVILLSGGTGTRLNAPIPKQYLPLSGKAMVLHSLEKFLEHPDILEIVVVCATQFRPLFHSSTTPLVFALPGSSRQESVYNGLQCTSDAASLICIHDGARPFLTQEDLDAVLLAARQYGAATLGSPIKNTLKVAKEDGTIATTLDRTNLWEVYTPQVATPELLKKGFSLARTSGFLATDDSSIVALTEHPVQLVLGNSHNIKITTAEDLLLAEKLAEELLHV